MVLLHKSTLTPVEKKKVAVLKIFENGVRPKKLIPMIPAESRLIFFYQRLQFMSSSTLFA